MQPYSYCDRDESGFIGSKIEAYYGKSVIDDITGDFCFIVKKNGNEVFRKTNTQLSDFAGEHSPQGMLIAGLMMYLNR
jgi:hypothetical protein